MDHTLFSGLSANEIKLSREKHGMNIFEGKKKNSFLKLFFSGFCDPIVEILIFALAVNLIFSFQTFHWYETAGIFCAIIISTLVSTLSEMGSEKAFEKMQENASGGMVAVKRENKLISIPREEIAVGDIIIIGAGEMVPADGILLQGEIKIDQSAINGESKEAKKKPKLKNSFLHDGENQLFQGTLCTYGSGIMRATAIGKDTLYGKIAKSLTDDANPSPLKERLSRLAAQISKIGYISALTVCIISLFHSFIICGNFDIAQIRALLSDSRYVFSELLAALALALTVVVVAVPEGLPMMISVVLSANMKKMMKENVLVKKPVAIETAGSMNILFTDKTGTITEGRQSLSQIILGGGTIYSGKEKIKKSAVYQKFAEAILYTSECSITGSAVHGSNSTDRALTEFCIRERMQKRAIMQRKPFDSADKYSEIRFYDNSGYIKGAPEYLIGKTNAIYNESGEKIYDFDKEKLYELYSENANKGKRIIFIGEKNSAGEISLIAFAVINDPIRRDARKSAEKLCAAGIKIIMITGDGKETAKYIASECGILKENDLIFSGAEIAKMSDEELISVLPKISVIYRLLPDDKKHLIEAAHKAGLIAGMTGDGINDAPALKLSDVGFAMQSGTQVAKEAGGIVLLDNSLLSISKAVLYGRTIFKSIRKFIVFQLSMNFAAVGISVIAPLFGIDTPISIMQMLWINLIMDTLGGLAFAGEGARSEYMLEKPKAKNEKIMSRGMISQIKELSICAVVFLTLFLNLPIFRNQFRFYTDYPYFMTVFFSSFIFMAINIAFCARTERINIFSGLSKNRAFRLVMLFVFAVQIAIIFHGGKLFSTIPISIKDILFSFIFAFGIIIFDSIRKFAKKRKSGN